MTKIKRSEIATFLNVSTTTGASYKLLGVGVTTGKINYNPKTTEETYIHEDSATTVLDSYAPVMPVEMTAVAGNDIFNFVDGLRQTRAVLDDAETDLVNVYYYQSSSGSGYPAEKQSVSIQVDDFGGDGGTPAKIVFTFNYLGAGTSGRYYPSSSSFVAS